MAESRTFTSVSSGKVEARHFKGQWTITASDNQGKVLDILRDSESPGDDSIRIFLSNSGMSDLMSELKSYVSDVMLRARHGIGY